MFESKVYKGPRRVNLKLKSEAFKCLSASAVDTQYVQDEHPSAVRTGSDYENYY